MSKLYKYGFWILIIVAFSFFNLWRITKINSDKDFKSTREFNNKRISSLLASDIIIRRKIMPLTGWDILTNKKENDLLKGSSLVILLADFKCNKCQEKELERLDSLKTIVDKKGIRVMGITTKAKMDVVISERKITKFNFPVYRIDDESFYKNIAFSNEFPQLLYVVDNVIITAFRPVPLDTEFSKLFYYYLLNKRF
ncbi:MAG: hypothetical protein WB996_07675 [Ignavibacteriaceae bacterium]